jgi:hypothetical protein
MIPNDPRFLFVYGFWAIEFKIALKEITKVFSGHLFASRNSAELLCS